jgi:hypothetical protein
MDMNIKALITTFALIGSASVAMARPATFTVNAEASWSFGTRTSSNDRVVIRDHRGRVNQPAPQPIYDDVRDERVMFPSNNVLTEDASVYKGPLPAARTGYYGHSYRPTSWITVTAPTRIDRGRQFISDLPDFGTVSRVRLVSNAGQTSIEKVLVRFADGGEQVVTLNRSLNRWYQTLDFQLNGARKVASFVVYGSSSNGAAYQILAM